MAEIWGSIQQEMIDSLKQARSALSHAPSKGTANEDAVANFLREHLPSSIAITSGQVVDSAGNQSRQLDAILYDASRTPLLYSDKGRTIQVLPIEGVIAVVEVKTHVTAADVPAIIENMRSVKELVRQAYIPQNNTAVIELYRLFGMEMPYFPTIYSLFAFEVENLESFGSAMGAMNVTRPVHQRVDLSCLLDSGVLLNTEHSQDLFLAPQLPRQ